MKRFLSVVLISTAIIFLFTACGGGESDGVVEEEHMEDEHVDEDEHLEDEHMEDEHMEGEDEHMEEGMEMDHAHVEAPDEFASLSNPYAGDADAISAGQEIFEANCVTCHGPEGAGDGDAAAGLDPKPADLGDDTMMTTLTDGYLFWRVSKGGAMEPFNSAMIAWEGSLSEEQRWQVISYVRTFTEH